MTEGIMALELLQVLVDTIQEHYLMVTREHQEEEGILFLLDQDFLEQLELAMDRPLDKEQNILEVGKEKNTVEVDKEQDTLDQV